ncbi:uncharacterized protein F4807DRAFT_409910 [Annulohypoxylon truncatum]|uniref:uncharacterized protein n=1 Tax=Annulohypoxylon truncatum TaxID=327061 RepID=UPI002008D7A3|nr:uncharacterized protein F4807DRAFT_409910 [Annulohypoxylon truncatum]KAI1213954.1 hypothetical protein F4807DRAFT_409910 [Annulohypoxylon truncatum]
MNTHSLRMSERSRREMRQKSHFHDPFFGLKGLDPRPTSIATEIVDTEWDEDEDIVSEIEDDDPDSPRISLNSSGQPSVTTLSSYEEAQTPRSSRAREVYGFDFDSSKPVEGPRGPHLFRASTTSSFNSFEYQSALTLSPITPKTARPFEADHRFPLTYEPPPPKSRNSPFQFTHEKLVPGDLSLWSPEKVAQWMLNAGIEIPVAEKFVENDINGAILITLKFEDLKELSIQSFGVRTKVWEEIHVLRDSKAAAEAAAASPRPETPIEDEEAKEVKRERRRERKEESNGAPRSESVKRSRSVKGGQGKKKPAHEDIISPLESVSIVGIEQMMPKPHHCSKGENCSKYRRQQRMIEAFKRDHPFVDVEQGGIIMVAGDPGNPETAPAINRPSSTEALRPMSDAVPSVIASSDVLGPGMPPFQYLQEAALRNLQTRDPQEHVRQFLNFQHQHGDESSSSAEVPPTPPFEVPAIGTASTTPTPTPRPHEGLRALPKLAIPGQQQSQVQQHLQSQRHSQQQQLRSANQTPQPSHYPQRMDRAEALSPDLHNAPYRFGTPFSDMDVPLTAVPLGPVARDASQSVPPDMNYRTAPLISRSQSRASRRPSFQVMAPVEEDAAATPVARVYGHRYTHSVSPKTSSPPKPLSSSRHQQPLQAPPRPQYPWSPPSSRTAFERAAAPTQPALPPSAVKDAEGVTYAGPVKKRKTRMLRHEWHDHYATLKGTRLALHKDAATRSRALEYIDIDDYAIACSSLSTGSKLNAAFKAMSISRSSKNSGGSSAADPDSVAAFSFQLIPQQSEGGRAPGALGGRLRKRESQSVGSGPLLPSPPGIEGAANGTGKTHHFAVRSRDERIDWMRELMLAKALKQKGEGFEVSVNGNMI